MTQINLTTSTPLRVSNNSCLHKRTLMHINTHRFSVISLLSEEHVGFQEDFIETNKNYYCSYKCKCPVIPYRANDMSQSQSYNQNVVSKLG